MMGPNIRPKKEIFDFQQLLGHELYARIVNGWRQTPTDGSKRRLTPSVDIF
jgi:hypothetical protein